MTVGIVMLAHTDFARAEQVARHWHHGGCPVVIHVDHKVPADIYERFKTSLDDVDAIQVHRKFKCKWGMWGLVAATQYATQLLLDTFPDVRHVYLCSGSCLPLRPVQELVAYLDQNPDTDFIESATIDDVNWAVDGLEKERFTLRFPFPWRTQRRLFDRYVKLQRRLRVKRRIPKGITPHIGSQWWCLTRQTLTAILSDPQRRKYDRYFRRVWIPDESYFQTLARKFSRKVESRSLTLSKFDHQGKPHIFYDDHLQLLRRSDCFVARKIWAKAHRLYDSFLRTPEDALKKSEPQPGKIDRLFSKAADRRIKGRMGLTMQSRLIVDDWQYGLTAAPYSIFQGFDAVFKDFDAWLARRVPGQVHGRLFAKEGVEYAQNNKFFKGALTDNAALRDYDPKGFLRNFIWNARDEYQCFQYGPEDNQKIHWDFALDPNARIAVISGGWVIPYFKSNLDFDVIRKQAAALQRYEKKQVDGLRSVYAKADIRVWSLAEFLEAPLDNLRAALELTQPGLGHGLADVPQMADLTGFGTFVNNLKNHGLHPHVLGDYREPTAENPGAKPTPRKPYLVQ